MKKGYADTVHGQIHYRQEGDGEALILLHRTPLSSEDFVPVLPLLSERYRVIAMDTLGYGNSDCPTRRYTLADYARSVVDFMDALGVRHASLLGEHTGAAIAAEVAIEFPDRLDKLVVSGYPLFTQEELATRRLGQVPEHSRQIEPLELKFDGSHLLVVWQHARDGLRIQDKPLSEIQAVTLSILQSGARNVEAHLALWQYRPETRLPRIKTPTLVLMTTEDQFYDRAEAVRRLIPGSRVKIVPYGGFYAPHNAPEEFAGAILEYLVAQPGASTA